MKLTLSIFVFLEIYVLIFAQTEYEDFPDYDSSVKNVSSYETNLKSVTDNIDEIDDDNREEPKLDSNLSEEIDTCGNPPEIENSKIIGSSNPPYAIGTILSYSCKFGYSADGASHIATCSQTSPGNKPTWTDPNIFCVPQSCGDPGFVPNANRIGSRFTFPNSVTFKCEGGYEQRGLSVRYCQVNGRWSGSLPSCEKIFCNRPENPANGRVSFSSLEFGSELKYECNNGFVLKNHQTRVCSENGTWSGTEPECRDTPCSVPVSPEYGSVELVGDKPRVGSIALYKCDGNRRLIGSVTSKCLDIGEWTFPAPKCVEPCSVPSVPHGQIGKYESSGWRRNQKRFTTLAPGTSLVEGEELFLKCDQKYEPFGNNKAEEKVSCVKGEWLKTPSCEPAKCWNNPPPMSNGRTHRIEREHGGIVVYHCNRNFKKTKYGNVTCNFGLWTGFTPICSDTRCYVDKLKFSGLVAGSKKIYSSKESFQPKCEKGYQVYAPQNTLTCEEGNWKGLLPPCTAASCSTPPPSVKQGKIKQYTNVHGSKVSYECDEGYILQVTTGVQCLFGEWKGSPPLCKDTRCNFLDLQMKIGMIPPSNDLTDNGETVEVICAQGYHHININPICSRGEWKELGTSPCKENNCQVIRIGNGALTSRESKKRWTWKGWVSEFVYSQAQLGTAKQPGEHLFVTCNNDFYFQGKNMNDVRTTCMKGVWKPTPVCLHYGAVYEEKVELEQPITRTTKSNSDARKEAISTTSLQTISTEEILYSTPKSLLLPTEVKEDFVDDCFCIYEGADNLVAIVANKRLERGDRVKSGSVVHFNCLDFGYDRLMGSTEIVCKNCKNWHSSEYPDCVRPSIGDTVIRPDPNFIHYLPGGVLTMNPMTDVQINCISNGIAAFPKWTSNVNRDYWYTIDVFDQPDGHQYYSNVLGILGAGPQHNGIYSCAIDNYRATTIQIQVTVQCEILHEGEELVIHYDRKQYVNSSALFSCKDKNKKLEGSSVITCLSNGQWSSQPPRCIAVVRCPKIEETDNMHVTHSQGREIGSIASFSCSPPNTIKGNSRIRCLDTGSWSSNVPTCTSIECLKLEETQGMSITYSHGLAVGSTATFHCLLPNVLNGDSSMRCLPSGEWSANLPLCILPRCHIGDLYEHIPEKVIPNIEKVDDATVPLGFELPLSCEENLRLIEPASAKCDQGGKWTISKAICAFGCGSAELLAKSPQLIIEPHKENYRMGELVSLSCAPGQELSNEVEMIMCLSDGWSEKELPICKDS